MVLGWRRERMRIGTARAVIASGAGMLLAATTLGGCGAASVPGTATAPGAASASASSGLPPSWASRAAPGVVNDVIVVDGRLLAVGATLPAASASSGAASAWTSADGLTWELLAVDGSAAVMKAVAHGPLGFVAVGGSDVPSSRPIAWASGDGRSWAATSAAAFRPEPGCDQASLEDVAAGPGGFVAVGVEWGGCGQHGVAWFSPDGRTWSRAPSAMGGNATRVVTASGARYVAAGAADAAAGEGMRAAFWWSTDGRSWTMVRDAADFHGAEPAAAAATSSGFVAVGSAIEGRTLTVRAWRSSDGQIWQRVQAPSLAVTPPSTGSTAPSVAMPSEMALGGEILAAGDGWVATGAATTIGAGDGQGPTAPWRVSVWASGSGAGWARLPDDPALLLRASPSYNHGPSALATHHDKLLLFGTLAPNRPEDARIWETDLADVLGSQAR